MYEVYVNTMNKLQNYGPYIDKCLLGKNYKISTIIFEV